MYTQCILRFLRYKNDYTISCVFVNLFFYILWFVFSFFQQRQHRKPRKYKRLSNIAKLFRYSLAIFYLLYLVFLVTSHPKIHKKLV